MSPKYIDVHSHIHFKQYDADREEVIARMKEAGVGAITVGTDLESSKKAVELAAQHENIWATVGIHPTDTKEVFNEKDFTELVKHPKVVAIGECGLDYYRVKGEGERVEEEKKKQKENFIKQIEFALKHEKPLIIHCRPSQGSDDAHETMIEILSSYFPKPYPLNPTPSLLRGNIHFFTGTIEIAEKYFELGFTVSLSGVITFTKELEDMVKSLPLDKILSETDCPYASPVPFRGKRNEPAFVVEVVRKIAEVHKKPMEKVKQQILSNARKVFGIAI